MNVESILKTKGADVLTITPDLTVQEVARILGEKKIGAMIVSADGKEIGGIVSERDVVRYIGLRGHDILDKPVTEVMTKDVFSATLHDTIAQLMALMTEKRIRHLPVKKDDGTLGGIISIGDVVKFRIEETEREAAAMRDYIATG